MNRRRRALRFPVSMPKQFKLLATYNSEVARGLVHTPAWRATMAELQVQFDAWQREQATAGVNVGIAVEVEE